MPSYEDILEAARTTVDTLKEIGIDDCYFIGGMACKLYAGGRGRLPKVCYQKTRAPVRTFIIDGRLHQDLDIVCPVTDETDDIKKRLCQENSEFYTVKARSRRDRYNVLWYEWCNDDDELEKIKVDILTPEIAKLQLPEIHQDYIVKINKLPCAPLHLLLLHKLKAWDDRLYSRPHLRCKRPVDAKDIKYLLQHAIQRGLNIANPKPYITDAFREDSYERARKYVQEYPLREDDFEELGFDL